MLERCYSKASGSPIIQKVYMGGGVVNVGCYYGLNCASLPFPDSHPCWNPKPCTSEWVPLKRERAFKEVFKLKEAKVGPHPIWPVSLLKEEIWTHRERPGMQAGRGKSTWGRSEEGPSASQGERSPEKPRLPTPRPWTSGFQKCEKIHLCCVSHAAWADSWKRFKDECSSSGEAGVMWAPGAAGSLQGRN